VAGTKTGRRNLSGVADVRSGSAKWEELNREQKFNIVYDKTLPLQVRIANKLVYNLKKFESITSEDYLEIDDIIQDCSLLLWKLLDIYDKISYEDFLRLYKSSIWKSIYLYGISKAKLKKNACLTEPALSDDIPDDDIKKEEPVPDSPVTSGFDSLFNKMDMEWVKNGFAKFLQDADSITKTDKKVFNIIAYPPDGFVDFCYNRNKNDLKNPVNNMGIAKFLDISPTGVGKGIQRLTNAFSQYKRRVSDDNRKVQKQKI